MAGGKKSRRKSSQLSARASAQEPTNEASIDFSRMTLEAPPEIQSTARPRVRKLKTEQPARTPSKASSSMGSQSREGPSREGSARDTATTDTPGGDPSRGTASRVRQPGDHEPPGSSLPRFSEAKWGIGEEREPGGAAQRSSPTARSQGSSRANGSTTSSEMGSLDLAMHEILFADYTGITGHVTIGGRLPAGVDSILKKKEEGIGEQDSGGGRQQDMALIKLVATNKIDPMEARTIKSKLIGANELFHIRIMKALEMYGALGQLAEVVQLKLFIANVAVERLVEAYEKLGRCRGCPNPLCKRSIPLENVAHPYEQRDIIDRLADNMTNFRASREFQTKLADASFLLALNRRIAEYHSHCMYDRSIQLRLTLHREAIFPDLRWTGQEVDFIEGHDDLLKDCAQASKIGAPNTGICGPAFATDRPNAESSRGFLSAPPPAIQARPEDTSFRRRAVECVMRGMVDGRALQQSNSCNDGLWELTTDGVVVASILVDHTGQSPDGAAGTGTYLAPFNATIELRRLFGKIVPRNAKERRDKADLLKVTSGPRNGFKEMEAMHRNWLKKWLAEPSTVPRSLEPVMDQERQQLKFRIDLERAVHETEEHLRRALSR